MTPAIPKITPPRAAKAISRPRLTRRLAGTAQKRGIWVSGPPGAGKTTAVVDFLAHHREAVIFYQIDSDDTDPGNFFHYMNLAARRTTRHRRRLPAFRPQEDLDLASFSRRFFRELYGRLGNRFTLVFDDYHAVSDQSDLHYVINEALLELPATGRIIVLSRAEPPPRLARLVSNRFFSSIRWPELKMTLSETRKLMRQLGASSGSAPRLEALHQSLDGWAAGLILAHQLGGNRHELPDRPNDASREAIFGYFASEILEREAPALRDFLMKSAFLGRMTAKDAARVTDNPKAGTILSRLVRRNYFTLSRQDKQSRIFEYHPLFREFLVASAHETFDDAELRHVSIAAAEILAESLDIHGAVTALNQVGEHRKAATVLQTNGYKLIRQGRGAVLREGLRSLPSETLQDGWLQMLLGFASLGIDQASTIDCAERAFHLFKTEDNRPGMLSAVATAGSSFLFAHGDFRPASAWIDRVDLVLDQDVEYPNEDFEIRVTSTLVGMLTLAQPDHPRLPDLGARLHSLWWRDPDPQSRLRSGASLALWRLWTGEVAKGRAIVDELRSLAGSQRDWALPLLPALSCAARCAWWSGDFDFGQRVLADVLPTQGEKGSRRFAAVLSEAAAMFLSLGRCDEARIYLQQMQDAVPADALYLQSRNRSLRAWERVLAGDASTAHQHAKIARDFAGEARVPFAVAASELSLAQIEHQLGKRDAAPSRIETARTIADNGACPGLQFAACITEAESLLDDGNDPRANKPIAEAMTIGARYSIQNIEFWRPDLMARICRSALEMGVEVEYTTGLVRTRGLVTRDPPYEIARWPWPIAVHTLGEFFIERDGLRLPASRKVQQRPLTLLKALIARGRRGATTTAVADDLWPDADGDFALRSLTVALHRLRKLLGSEEAVSLNGGILRINERLVWVDALAVEELLTRAVSSERGSPEHANTLHQRVISLSHGPFLPHDLDQPWAAKARRQLADLRERSQRWLDHHTDSEARRLRRVR